MSAIDKSLNGVGDGDVDTRKADSIELTSNKVEVSKKDVTSLDNGKVDSKVLFPGDIIIKAQLDDDIRCTNYNNQELTFVDLLKLLERMFKKAIKSTDDLVIKYKDGDGDLVTIEDTDDVGFAIRACGGLNVKIYRNKKQELRKLKATDEFRAELIDIRDRVNKLLTELDVTEPGNVVGATLAPNSTKDLTSSPSTDALAPSNKSIVRGTQIVANEQTSQSTPTNEATEFDPLSSVASSGEFRTDFLLASHPQASTSGGPNNQVSIKGEPQTDGTVTSQPGAPQYHATASPSVQPRQQSQPATAVYNSPSTYGASNHFQQYPAAPLSYGGAPSSYGNLVNSTPPTTNASYPQNMVINPTMTPAGQQVTMSPLPTGGSQTAYGGITPSTHPIYGQIGSTQAPPSIGNVQCPPSGTQGIVPPPPMSGVHGPPPMGAQFRSPAPLPPPPAGAGPAGGSSNPYSRIASRPY